MAFVPGFEHDIFISYAHDNNPGGEAGAGGWVTQFHRLLEEQLRQLTDRELRLWRDRRLGRNQVFDQTIKDAVDHSAVFLAINSRSYRNSPYCQQEIEWFVVQSQNDGYGTNIGDRKRIFNLLLNNLPFAQWPQPFQGATCYNFFEPEPDDEIGLPAESESAQFKSELKVLLRDLARTLLKFKDTAEARAKQAAPAPPSPNGNGANGNGTTPVAPNFAVFLAETSEDLRRTLRRRVLNELKEQGIRLTEEVPLLDSQEHDQRASTAIQHADLCLHLFDHSPGRDISDQPEQFYPQRQAELGLQHAKAQFFCVSSGLDYQTIADEGYRRFLEDLERGERAGRRYRFIRGQMTADAIVREVLAFREQRQKEQASQQQTASAALFDGHFKDIGCAAQLYPLLESRQVSSRLNIGGDNPREKVEELVRQLRQANRLILVYGESGREWVKYRLAEAVKLCLEEEIQLKPCCIYFAPPRSVQSDGRFDFGWLPVQQFDSTNLDNGFLDWLAE